MRILVPLAEGFEEMEAVITIDMLRRCGADVVTAAIGPTRETKGSRKIPVVADALWQDCTSATWDALVIPGGQPGVNNLRADTRVATLAKTLHSQGKLVAAICAAPLVLHDAGLLKDRRFTCYPSCETEIIGATYTAARTVEDGNLITGCGPGATFEFALRVAATLMGADIAQRAGQAACVKQD